MIEIARSCAHSRCEWGDEELTQYPGDQADIPKTVYDFHNGTDTTVISNGTGIITDILNGT